MLGQLLWLVEQLERRDIAFWLDSGTLLGMVRDGCILAHDNDIDIGVWADQISALNVAFEELRLEGLRVRRLLYNSQVFKYVMERRPPRGWLPVHLNVYRVHESFAWCPWVGILHNRSELRFKLRKKVGRTARSLVPQHDVRAVPWRYLYDRGVWVIPERYFRTTTRLDGADIPVPVDYDHYLEFRYGDWRVPVEDWHCVRDDKALKLIPPGKWMQSPGFT